MNPIARETYKDLPNSNKLDVLFDITMELHICSCETRDRVTALEKKVDKRKLFDTSIAGGTGLMGGFLAILGQKIFK